ncbi:nucleotide-binding universal stress UspA family protein [Kitasatospora sp. MAA4]|uniref:universal stress protein n=1 Tax=Kitasatospora sp. MAA4 TaxID=3035093 RepID=UPI00247715B7|nr:universal stress protein [Kitasatospora sp. MAA4]MDH6137471.1 nucleotide-binding universal stress UspA family protein [Kitasatospora sp. MAA4]
MRQQRRIVVGVSGSLGSLAALHQAVDEARRAGGEVLAVLAWTPPGGEYGFRRSPCPPLLAACRAAAVQRIRDAVGEAFPDGVVGVPFSCQVVRDDAGAALVGSADRADDLLVVGAGGGGLLRRALRPSVTAYCVQHAGCPVLSVPRPALQRELAAIERRAAWHLPFEPVPGG